MKQQNQSIELKRYLADVQDRADKVVDKFVIGFFAIGLALAPVYETWAFSLLIGGLNLALYLISKLVKNKFFSRQIISFVFAVFMLQFIGQMHGMAEMHFFFFTNIAILIIYQDWRMMIPYAFFTILHHSVFFYLQLLGYDHMGYYFINYAEVDMKLLFFHFALVILMSFISAWWSIKFRNQSIAMVMARAEVTASNEELTQNIAALERTQESLGASQNKLSSVLLNTGIGTWEYDVKDRIMTLNEQSAQFYGLSVGSNAELSIAGEEWIQYVNAEYHQALREFVSGYVEGKNQQNEIEYKTAPKSGEPKVLLIRFAKDPKALFENGKLLGTIEDISERKKLEEQISIQNKELQHSLSTVLQLREKSEKSKAEALKAIDKMAGSMNYARKIQNAILPSEDDLKRVLPQSFVVNKPRDVVSGDFYWLAEKEDAIILAVGDCTGHGMPGALMTMIANDILNKIVHDLEIHEPEQILNLVPEQLKRIISYHAQQVPDGMDMGIVTIRKKSNHTSVAFAGAMNPLYYVQEGMIYVLKGDKLPIGGHYKKKERNYQRFEIEIDRPTCFYMASDGYQDQFGGPENRKFMKKHFREWLQTIFLEPMENQKQILEDTFDAWKGKQKQTDDVLVVGFGLNQ